MALQVLQVVIVTFLMVGVKAQPAEAGRARPGSRPGRAICVCFGEAVLPRSPVQALRELQELEPVRAAGAE